MTQAARWIVGCMTGTSLDGLDVALVEVMGHGLDMMPRLIGHHSQSLDELRASLLTLASHEPQPPAVYLRTARRLGELHVRAIDELCRKHLPAAAKLNFVTAHGQTICHLPGEHLSWQLFDPWPLVHSGVPVIHDLRQADLIAGGEGAPITPITDWIVFRDATRSRAVVNLGGICNVTVLPANAPPSAIDGGDVGPCNLLLDGLAQHLLDEPFDVDGRRARAGQARKVLVDQVDAHIASVVKVGKTLGREQFSAPWLDALLRQFDKGAAPEDLLASAVDAVARQIGTGRWLADVDEMILAGGGARHGGLVQALVRHARRACVRTSDAHGVPVEAREAMAVAVLGALCRDGVPITLSHITGATNPGVAGTQVGFEIR